MNGKIDKTVKKSTATAITTAAAITVTITAFAVAALLGGCAPSVVLQVERPPLLQGVAGVKRIAVMPFDGGGDAAVHATNIATMRLTSANYFTPVSPDRVRQTRRNRGELENIVDAVIVGRVNRAESERDQESGSYTNREGQTVHYTNYTTTAEVELQYHLELARDGTLVGPVIRTAQRSATSREGFPNPAPLVRSAVEDALNDIHRQLSPHTITVRRTFKTDKNPAARDDMRTAASLVRAGNYRQALDMYRAVFERTQSAAAAVNASYLLEATGDARGAAEFMRRAVEVTGNPIAQTRLAALEKILADAATLARDFTGGEGGNLRGRVARHAAENIARVVSPGATVWFYNADRGNAVTEGVEADITASFTERGIRVVDRRHAELIAAEQNFQMSGMVNDGEITRIGQASGANTIVIIGVIGEAANRRLTVRVLDVETRRVLMQSNADRSWHI